MFKEKRPGEWVSRQGSSVVGRVGRGVCVCVFVVLLSLIVAPGTSFAHSSVKEDALPACNAFFFPTPVIEEFYNPASKHLVTADLNASGELRTFVNVGGTWERFLVWKCVGNPNIYAFQSTANGHFVSARQDASGTLMALASGINTWEEFQADCIPGGIICNFQSVVNGNYVSARLDDPNEPVMALVPDAQSWELFELTLPLP